jgi:hypothetical protein
MYLVKLDSTLLLQGVKLPSAQNDPLRLVSTGVEPEVGRTGSVVMGER